MTHDILHSDITLATRLMGDHRPDQEIILALVQRGVDPAKAAKLLDDLRSGCGFDLLAEKGAALEDAASQGLLRRHADRIAPTLAGMAVADPLAVDLAPDSAD